MYQANGTVLVFETGILTVNFPSGEGTLAFKESNIHQDSGDDYPYIYIAKSELLAIRDYLNREFPMEKEQ